MHGIGCVGQTTYIVVPEFNNYIYLSKAKSKMRFTILKQFSVFKVKNGKLASDLEYYELHFYGSEYNELHFYGSRIDVMSQVKCAAVF